MVAHDFTYPLGTYCYGKFWHNLNEQSLHLTIADTGWEKPFGETLRTMDSRSQCIRLRS